MIVRPLLTLLLGLMLAAPAGAEPYRLLRIDGLRLKWGAPSLASGATVTWRRATAAASFPDAVNCRGIEPLHAIRTSPRQGPEVLDAALEQAFGIWSEAADIRFEPARPGARADILIGAQAHPRRVAFANVWWDAGAARRGIAPLTRATICLNPALTWGTDDATGGSGALDLVYVLAHEIGHAIGLDHPGATGALMGYRRADGDGLMPGDVAGARALYGTP